VPGRWIIIASWTQNVLFFATALPVALGADALESTAVGTAVALFAVSLVVWTWSFAVAVARSTQGDDIVVANQYFTVGGAPRDVRLHLFGSVGLSLVIAAGSAAFEPFGVLVPMLPLAFVGLWAVRHGTFPRRRNV
jgi:hypothetical protein